MRENRPESMRRVVAGAVVVAALSLGFPAAGTTVLPLSLEDLVERSDIVAHVRVGEVRVEQRDSTPFRVTTLYVIEGFDGVGRGQSLEIWQRGDGRIFVIGDPWLEPGEEALVFLRRVDGSLYLTALAQSVWRLEGQGAATIARRDLSSLMILPMGAPRVMPPDRLPWERLRQMVLDAVMGVQP